MKCVIFVRLCSLVIKLQVEPAWSGKEILWLLEVELRIQYGKQ